MAADVVLVTGSSGLIGSAVIRRLAGRFSMVGFDRAGDPQPPTEAECVCVDMSSDASIASAFDRFRFAHGERIASVVHLAAYYDFSGAPSPLYREVTVEGTGRLLDALQEFKVEQFLFSSTMLVHAPVRPGELISEESQLRPTWAYPASKVETERLIGERRGPIPAVVLRIAGVYDDVGHSPPIADQVRRVYERRLTSHLYPGPLDRGSAFVHLGDVVDAIVSAVERRGSLPDESTVLIGEEEVMGYGELQDEIGRLVHDRSWTTYEVPKWVAKVGAWIQDRLPFLDDPFIKPWMVDRADDHFALDTTRARQLLRWSPKRSLRRTLPMIVGALKADAKEWYRRNDFADAS